MPPSIARTLAPALLLLGPAALLAQDAKPPKRGVTKYTFEDSKS